MMLAKRNSYMMPSLLNELLDWNNWNQAPTSEGAVSPKMNVSESKTDYRLELCVPGLKKEDINISIDTENNLVIEMNKKEEHEEKDDRHYLRREFSSTQFKQVLSLPENVKRENISAKAAHGVLTVTLPKVTEEEKKALAQTIQID
ncbi:MAG: Hsp20/alpha crystallin family protein [Bacteroidales bacterium]|nr:Hsp20/alpha crystallin family protein [Bacteroidales bacterium]